MDQHESPLWVRRLLVIAFYLSVLACLLAIWFSGTLFGNASQILPLWLLRGIANYRVSVLVAPCTCLLIWYAMLRHVTGDIMAVPERYLDERQKMVRDQAHRSAFRLVKLICCLLPLLLLTQYFLPRQSAPASAPTTVVAPVEHVVQYTLYIPDSGLLLWSSGSVLKQPPHMPVSMYRILQAAQKLKQPSHTPVGIHLLLSSDVKPVTLLTIRQLPIRTPPIAPIPPIAPATGAEIALAVGVLLLCLYLLFSALPMSVIAWKRRL